MSQLTGRARALAKFASLRLPVVAAPMFLVSGPHAVVAQCRAGVVGTFPALNARTETQLAAWLAEIRDAVADAPFGVNLIVHRTNPRLAAQLDVVREHRVPVVITSLGAARAVVDAVHEYGGVVLHDVTNATHAAKAVGAGVDGLIAVCAGAGGHAGLLSPFALIPQLRAAFPDTALLLAGAIGDGHGVRAALALGADLAYMGTRFIATKESMASPDYKSMLVDAKSGPPPTFSPIVYTDRISGVYANFIRESLIRNKLDPAALARAEPVEEDFSKLDSESKAWKDIWSAGHGILNIHDVPTTQELVDRLYAEYKVAGKAAKL